MRPRLSCSTIDTPTVTNNRFVAAPFEIRLVSNDALAVRDVGRRDGRQSPTSLLRKPFPRRTLHRCLHPAGSRSPSYGETYLACFARPRTRSLPCRAQRKGAKARGRTVYRMVCIDKRRVNRYRLRPCVRFEVSKCARRRRE